MLENNQQISDQNYDENQQFLGLNYCVDSWQRILMSKNWVKLRVLDLSFCNISDVRILKLLNLNLPQLTDLNLYQNSFSIDSMKVLLDEGDWPKLQSLRIGKIIVGDKDIFWIIQKIKKLKCLGLSDCNLNSFHIKSSMLNNNHQSSNLKQIYLSRNMIGNQGIKWLIKSQLPNLQSLDLDNNQLGSQGYKHLSKGNWPNLNYLCLIWDQDQQGNCNKILINEGCQIISENNWYQLNRLYIRQSSPICLMNFVLVVSSNVKISKQCMYIQNEKLFTQLQSIFDRRNLLQEQ